MVEEEEDGSRIGEGPSDGFSLDLLHFRLFVFGV